MARKRGTKRRRHGLDVKALTRTARTLLAPELRKVVASQSNPLVTIPALGAIDTANKLADHLGYGRRRRRGGRRRRHGLVGQGIGGIARIFL